jgi:alkylhydroperoxidase family enzyme
VAATPERLAPLPPKAWPPEMKDAFAALQPPNPRHPPLGKPGGPKGLNALGIFAHHPELTRAFYTFNGHVLLASTLSIRDRELVVLRVAALRDSEYEWAQHQLIALDAGLTADDIARVRSGPDAAGWSDNDAALLRAADELVHDAQLTDATWAALAATYDTQQLLDLVFTIGAYDLIAMVFNTFGVQLDDDLREAAST